MELLVNCAFWGASLCNPTFHYCIAVKVCKYRPDMQPSVCAWRPTAGRRDRVVNRGVLYCAVCRVIVRRLARLVFGSAKAVETRRGARNKVGMVC